MDLDRGNWEGLTVLVTGHTGFKGSWLVLMLKLLGAKVVGYSLPAVPESNYLFAHLSSEVHQEYLLDIRDYELLRHAFEKTKPDYVFHLAAQAIVSLAAKNPLDTISTNVVGTSNVLLAALSCKSVRGVTIVTTDKVYENKEWSYPYRENDRLGGNETYGASKTASEFIVAALAKSNNPRQIPVATARAGNVVGGGDWGVDRLVPDLVRAVQQGAPIRLRNPTATRPWQHVLDCLTGYIGIGDCHLTEKKLPTSLNFGSSDSINVASLISVFEGVMGVRVSVANMEASYIENYKLQIDANLSKIELGWSPKYSAYESIVATAKWYKRFLEGEDARDLMLEEISFYQGRTE